MGGEYGLLGEGLKQRLIGAVVLLILLVVLAPALFSGGENHPIVTSEADSDRVELVSPPVPAFVEQLNVEPEPVSVSLTEENEPEPLTLSVKPSGTDEKGALKVWSLRLATFSDKKNADSLEKTLKEKGYSSYSNQVIAANGNKLYRVYIGPEAKAEEFQSLKSKLEKRTMRLD